MTEQGKVLAQRPTLRVPGPDSDAEQIRLQIACLELEATRLERQASPLRVRANDLRRVLESMNEPL